MAHRGAYVATAAHTVAWAIVTAAHELDHIPPMPHLDMLSVSGNPAHQSASPFAIAAQLSDTSPPVIYEVDASQSASELGCIRSCEWVTLRGGDGVSITPMRADSSRVRIEIPWQAVDNRTDIVLIINDGYTDGAPAYISIDQLKSSY